MEDDNYKRNKAKKHFKKGIEDISALSAEARLQIYHELFGKDGELDKSTVFYANTAAIKLKRLPGGGFSKGNVEISDNFIMPRRPRVFLSHSHQDKTFVRTLSSKLDSHGIKVWVDEAELRFGDSLIQRLREAIDTVDLLLTVLSNTSITSPWVEKEIEIAMNQEINGKRVKVIPLLIDDVALPGFLEGKLYADFTSQYRRKKNFKKLVNSIKAHLKD